MSIESRNTLLEYFKNLSDDKLYKLKKYSEMVLLPDTDVLTNVNMAQMVDKAHELADVYFPEWTDRSKSDFGEFLIELMALFSEKDFWYINAFSNEATLSTSRVYSNAYVKAASLGYNAQTCKGSTATFRITATELGTVLSVGELRVTVDGVNFYNSTPLAFTTQTLENITLTEGKYQQEYATFNGYNVQLLKENVDIDSIRVIYDNIEFNRVNFFGESVENSRDFRVLPEEDGGASIFFGDGEYGYRPPVGSTVLICYGLASGTDGNITAGNCSCDMPEIASINMTSNATGGCNAESLNSLREKAPLFFKGKTILNKKVGKEFLDSFECVRQSDIKFEGTHVKYFIIENPSYSRADALAILGGEFEPYCMVGYDIECLANTEIQIINPEGTYKYLRVDVTLDSMIYDTEEIENVIKREINLITDPDNGYATFGQSLTPADISYKIKGRLSTVRELTYWKQTSSVSDVTDVSLGSIQLSEGQIFSPISIENIIVNFI